jgi:preprotein translocase subunit Sec63
MNDPFSTLGVGEDADDDQIKQRYLSLVRLFPPDREPERFQAYRAAYEALSDQRKRLEAKLLSTHDTALARIKSHLLAPSKPVCARATKSTITALLIEGIDRPWGQDGTS